MPPETFAKYEAWIKGCLFAKKKHKPWPFEISSCDTERVRMSASQFQKLDDLLGNGELEYRYPSISFNSRTNTGIIQWMASGVHESLSSKFMLDSWIATVIDSPIADRVETVGPQQVNDFQGKYAGTKKEPDVLYKFEQANSDVIYTAVVEVGFSESYQDLVDDATAWIEGNRDIMTVILIKVEELPQYKSPLDELEDDEIERLKSLGSVNIKTSTVVPRDQNDSFGPLQLNDLTCVGKMSAFLEVWKRDGRTGKAKRQDPRMDFVPDRGLADPDFRLRDFYPVSDEQGGAKRMPMAWERLRQSLRRSRNELGVHRYREMLTQLAKWEGDSPGDRDYAPN